MSTVILAIVFGGKPEAIMWKVKTIVGEEKILSLQRRNCVLINQLINRLMPVIFACMILLYVGREGEIYIY